MQLIVYTGLFSFLWAMMFGGCMIIFINIMG
jgi:hypothetical protein